MGNYTGISARPLKKMEDLMKKIICAALILAAAVPLVFAGGGSDKASNKIVIYTSMYEDVIDAVQKDLRDEFPKYAIEFVYGGTGRLQYRVAEEKASGRPIWIPSNHATP